MRRVLLIAALLVVILVVVLISWATRATPFVRDRVVAAINERFASQVDLQTLQLGIFPRPQSTGGGLTLRHNGRTDVPPLITIETFSASAGLRGLFGTPVHLSEVTLDNLHIAIPPGGLHPGDDQDSPDDQAPPPAPSARDLPPAASSRGPAKSLAIVIDTIVSRHARLEVASRRAGRLPRIFDIENLVMSDFGAEQGSRFRADVINPIPKGRVETTGIFGPWNAEDPGRTPLGGDYTFSNADLDTIKGIGGILSSVGKYSGLLERIEVEGQTDTPDFSLDISGQPVPLKTQYKAIVDGTNGDTWLEQVNATLGQSTIVASGAVVRTENVSGRRVTLDVHIEQAHIEDLMHLAVKAAGTPLVGRIDMVTSFLLPAGDGDVVDRLQLKGQFALKQAKFTNIDVQKKINLLSRRGRGDETSDGSGASVVSNLRGQFALRNARLTFTNLMFAVPGAVIQLDGQYNLRTEDMNFTGYFLADATLADMTSGVKSLLARLAQPFFRRPGGGSKIPIRISGPRSNPTFGLDTRRVLKKD